MEKITLQIGTVSSTNSGQIIDRLRPVTFMGEKLARYTNNDNRNDRGTTKTLYKTHESKTNYVVYIENWTRYQGETSYYDLVRATTEDLDVNGRFEMLGRKAGFARDLTLSEALTESEDEDCLGTADDPAEDWWEN
jgi:hypothetical protein